MASELLTLPVKTHLLIRTQGLHTILLAFCLMVSSQNTVFQSYAGRFLFSPLSSLWLFFICINVSFIRHRLQSILGSSHNLVEFFCKFISRNVLTLWYTVLTNAWSCAAPTYRTISHPPDSLRLRLCNQPMSPLPMPASPWSAFSFCNFAFSGMSSNGIIQDIAFEV